MNDKIKSEVSPSPSLGSWLWYELGIHLTNLAFTFGSSLRVRGRHNVPATGPLLVIANHGSYFDPVLVGLAVRRHLVFLARKTLFRNPYFDKLISSFNAVPIDQDGVGKEGLKTIVEQLRQQRAVLVFPEGERTPHGGLLPLKPGIHLLMRRVECLVLPVGIAGAYEAFPIWRLLPRPAPIFMPAASGTIAVCVGKPLPSSAFADMQRDQALQLLGDEIRKLHLQAEALRRK